MGKCRSQSNLNHYGCSLPIIDDDDNLNMDKHLKSVMLCLFYHHMTPYVSLLPGSNCLYVLSIWNNFHLRILFNLFIIIRNLCVHLNYYLIQATGGFGAENMWHWPLPYSWASRKFIFPANILLIFHYVDLSAFTFYSFSLLTWWVFTLLKYLPMPVPVLSLNKQGTVLIHFARL